MQHALLPERHSRDSHPRWWPFLAATILLAAWLGWVWRSSADQRQLQVLQTFTGTAAWLILVLAWLLIFSRLRWRLRLTVLALVLGSFAVAGGLYRISGFTGDMIPIVTPRWNWMAPKERSVAKGSPSAVQELPESFLGYPQYLGPTRDGLIPGPRLARDWTAEPPELLWRVQVGEGYSGFAIAGRRALCLEQQGGTETLVCRDLFSGAILWSHGHEARFENSLGGVGPRTTPAVAGERVFAVGATGFLSAVELSTGKLLWERNVSTDASTTPPEWGLSGSPLVIDDLVIVHPGGPNHSLAAYRAATGELAWAAGDARPGYSSPQLVTLLGEPQVLIFNHDGVSGHALDGGKVLWSYPWSPTAQHVTDPRVIGPDRLVVSAGYGSGADLVQLSRDSDGGWKATRLWHSRRLKSKFASMVFRDGFLYGLDDGRLTCIDVATGEPRWKADRVGHGQVLLAGDLLVVSAENGEVLLVEATPDGARELGRFRALEGKMWNPAALAPPFLIVRTEKEAACYRLPLASERN